MRCNCLMKTPVLCVECNIKLCKFATLFNEVTKVGKLSFVINKKGMSYFNKWMYSNAIGIEKRNEVAQRLFTQKLFY